MQWKRGREFVSMSKKFILSYVRQALQVSL